MLVAATRVEAEDLGALIGQKEEEVERERVEDGPSREDPEDRRCRRRLSPRRPGNRGQERWLA